MSPSKTGRAPAIAEPAASARPTADPHRPIKRIVAKNEKVLYFTFNDGPSAEWTPKILDVLAKHHAHATFFPLEVEKYPNLVQQELAAGHTIGKYVYGSKARTSISADDVRKAVQAGPPSRCIRAPFGAMNQEVRDLATDLNLQVVSWDIDPEDWSRPGTNVIVKHVLDQQASDAIVLMYDGGGNRSQTVQALDQLLTKLAAQHYTFASLDC